MEADKHFVVGIFDNEDVVLEAVHKVRGQGVKIHEVYSPFPVHGLDEALGYKQSRLGIAAFLFGLTGTILAGTMEFWMLGFDWPMIIGGKDFSSLPPFVPVMFEATFFIVSDMKPYKWPRHYDIRSTNDKHVMAIDLATNQGKSKEELIKIMK
jgi:Alternative complex III, ActD subunit